MQNQQSEIDIFQARRPSEVLGGAEPILSSAKSNCSGVLIESYQVGEFGPTPRFCYTDHHLVSIQRDGVVKATVRSNIGKLWYPGAAVDTSRSRLLSQTLRFPM